MKMTTRRTLVAAFALAAAGVHAQDAGQAAAQRFADNARVALAKLEQGMHEVRPSKKVEGFFRIEWRLIGTPSMDVKRTDSVLEPVRATVEIPVRMGTTRRMDTAAEAADALANLTEDFRIQAVYVPAGEGWVLKSVRSYVKGVGSWMEGRTSVEDVVSLFEVAPPAPVAAPQPSTRSRSAINR